MAGISRIYETVIAVNDLAACRVFYRDTLGLGEPEPDSSFAVRFPLSADAALVLAASGAPYLEHLNSAVRFSFSCPDLAAVSARLTEAGCPPEHCGLRFGMREYLVCRDPEGNRFMIFESPAAEEK